MKISISILSLLSLFVVYSCNTTKNETERNDNRMEFTVSKIQDEKDGQTLFLKGDDGGRYETIISPANGNFVDVAVGNRISLVAEEIMESDPAQVLSKDIKVIANPIQLKITTDKQLYKAGEPIELALEVQNTGQKSYTFLPWGTPIENRFTGDCLHITRKGEVIDYSGIMVKRMAPTDKDYVTLEKGQSTQGKVNVLDGYKLLEKGVYEIQSKETYKGIPASNVVSIEIE